jgi:hypothetical protein
VAAVAYLAVVVLAVTDRPLQENLLAVELLPRAHSLSLFPQITLSQ